MNLYRDIRDLPALEREYSPSSCISNLDELLQAYAERSAQARSLNPRMQTLHYGEHPDESLDFFPAGGARDAPLLIFIHGGYWQQLSKLDASFPAVDCQRHGVAYAAINYGLAPAATISQMVTRCRTAVATLYRRAASHGVDQHSIYLCGSSAGAHLAAMTLLTSWQAFGLPQNPIRGAILLSGVFDLDPLIHTYINAPLHLDAAAARLLSPLLQLETSNARLPPVLLAHGDNETSEFKRQSAQFAQALRRRAVAVELMNIAGRNHFDITFDLVDERTELGGATLSLIGKFTASGES